MLSTRNIIIISAVSVCALIALITTLIVLLKQSNSAADDAQLGFNDLSNTTSNNNTTNNPSVFGLIPGNSNPASIPNPNQASIPNPNQASIPNPNQGFRPDLNPSSTNTTNQNPNTNNGCPNPVIRKEWRELTADEQQRLLNSMTSLKRQPSIMGQANRYDDFVYLHYTYRNQAHSVNNTQQVHDFIFLTHIAASIFFMASRIFITI